MERRRLREPGVCAGVGGHRQAWAGTVALPPAPRRARLTRKGPGREGEVGKDERLRARPTSCLHVRRACAERGHEDAPAMGCPEHSEHFHSRQNLFRLHKEFFKYRLGCFTRWEKTEETLSCLNKSNWNSRSKFNTKVN